MYIVSNIKGCDHPLCLLNSDHFLGFGPFKRNNAYYYGLLADDPKNSVALVEIKDESKLEEFGLYLNYAFERFVKVEFIEFSVILEFMQQRFKFVIFDNIENAKIKI